MLIKKLLAAVGIAGALLLGIAGSAEARGWGGGGRFHGPVYGGGFHRGSVYGGPVYRGPVYGGPVYGGEWRRDVWRRAEWRREHGRFGRFGYRY